MYIAKLVNILVHVVGSVCHLHKLHFETQGFIWGGEAFAPLGFQVPPPLDSKKIH